MKPLAACAVAVAVALGCSALRAPDGDRVAERQRGYFLPFPPGAAHKLLQGYAGPWGHQGHAEFAYDFQMPIGSPVRAARAGEVVHVVEGHDDGTRKPGDENVVVIKHADGTFARYYHLAKQGALVAAGEKVRRGQDIASSGDSGASAGPHLHFDVTGTCYEWGCQTLPIQFEGVEENPLRPGREYTAGA